MPDLSEAQRYSIATMRGMTVGERIKSARKAKGWTQAQLGEAVSLAQPTIAEMEAGKLKNWPQHATKIIRALGKPRGYFEPEGEEGSPSPDLPEVDPLIAYVEVEVLPTFAGMGGGGTGDADRVTAMLPRTLIEDELRAKPEDFLMINLRGDSMFNPETGKGFLHGDQVLVDRRDINPTQPGPFAIWYDDGYVLKNIERIRKSGRLRIFSNNPAYSADEADPSEITIMGRPVWFARRL